MDEGRVEFSSPAEHIAFGRMVGYLVWVTYDGRQFESFDDSPTDSAIKAYLVNILDDELRLRPKSALQHCVRTDAGMSALENVFLFDSNCRPDIESIVRRFNLKGSGVKITKMIKVLDHLYLHELLDSCEFFVRIPFEDPQLVTKNKNEISNACAKFTGTIDFADYTSAKASSTTRTVAVQYDEATGGLRFICEGQDFLPDQVAMMAAEILSGSKDTPLPPQLITLRSVSLNSNRLQNVAYRDVKEPLPAELSEAKQERCGDVLVLSLNDAQYDRMKENEGALEVQVRTSIGKVAYLRGWKETRPDGKALAKVLRREDRKRKGLPDEEAEAAMEDPQYKSSAEKRKEAEALLDRLRQIRGSS